MHRIYKGKYIANILGKDITIDNRKPFKYKDKGTMATIGKKKAIAQVGTFGFTGFFAWFLWSTIHLRYLVLSRNQFFF